MKWVYGILLVIQATFCTDYLVPLDSRAQGTFGGLLGWAWPWAVSDTGPLGTGFQITGFLHPGRRGRALRTRGPGGGRYPGSGWMVEATGSHGGGALDRLDVAVLRSDQVASDRG
jgi:hypothetical protein